MTSVLSAIAATSDPRAVPLISRHARLVESADIVLHATDQVFDFSFDGLPPRHHYAGPQSQVPLCCVIQL
jgi:hypothetical protein